MHSIGARKWMLVVALGLSLGCAQVAAESRVVRDEITGFGQPQVVAALKSAMEKQGCHIETEKTYKGTGVQEIKCAMSGEMVTGQVDHEYFSGVSRSGARLQYEFSGVWIKTSGGKTIWSKIIDQN